MVVSPDAAFVAVPFFIASFGDPSPLIWITVAPNVAVAGADDAESIVSNTNLFAPPRAPHESDRDGVGVALVREPEFNVRVRVGVTMLNVRETVPKSENRTLGDALLVSAPPEKLREEDLENVKREALWNTPQKA